MEKVFAYFDLLPWLFGGVLIVLGFLAVIRVFIKAKKGENVHTEPIGVFQDLPGTVTGLQNPKETRDE